MRYAPLLVLFFLNFNRVFLKIQRLCLHGKVQMNVKKGGVSVNGFIINENRKKYYHIYSPYNQNAIIIDTSDPLLSYEFTNSSSDNNDEKEDNDDNIEDNINIKKHSTS